MVDVSFITINFNSSNIFFPSLFIKRLTWQPCSSSFLGVMIVMGLSVQAAFTSSKTCHKYWLSAFAFVKTFIRKIKKLFDLNPKTNNINDF